MKDDIELLVQQMLGEDGYPDVILINSMIWDLTRYGSLTQSISLSISRYFKVSTDTAYSDNVYQKRIEIECMQKYLDRLVFPLLYRIPLSSLSLQYIDASPSFSCNSSSSYDGNLGLFPPLSSFYSKRKWTRRRNAGESNLTFTQTIHPVSVSTSCSRKKSLHQVCCFFKHSNHYSYLWLAAGSCDKIFVVILFQLILFSGVL